MNRLFEKSAAIAMDGVMCAMMNRLQWHRRDQVSSRDDLESYLTACEPLTREEFFRVPKPASPRRKDNWLIWDSPVPSGFPDNDSVRARLHPARKGHGAPTVLILHALMSASDFGYRRLARWFNDRGWNAVFPHLPYHYSRTPRGYLNGELAITANLVRNGETIRQCVIELRQLLNFLRKEGTGEFALLGTSYGGWNAALLSFLEPEFRFLALIQPIVNTEHAIWESPGSVAMRRLLRAKGIGPGDSIRHSHLTSPRHGIPVCGGDRAILTAGIYDTVSPAKDLLDLKHRWPGSKIIHVRQGHFGHAALSETLREIEPRLHTTD